MAWERVPAGLAGSIAELLLLVAPLVCAAEHELARLRCGDLNVVVLGHFKRGKSTLLNALLGRELAEQGLSSRCFSTDLEVARGEAGEGSC